MKKIIMIILLFIFLIGIVHGADESVEINNVEFKLPEKYQGGDLKSTYYKLDNIFIISCIDDDIAEAIGFWTREKDFSEDITIGKHPVRHTYSYVEFAEDNYSYAYFASGKSVYKIGWVGEKIDSDIEKLINNTPASKISKKNFYKLLDESYELYEVERHLQDEYDAHYNYYEAKYNEQLKQSKMNQEHDMKMKNIMITYI